MAGTWRHCSSCRAAIGFEQIYWECSVSTCARVARTGLFFCSVSCWEAHLPTMRHREAWAVEKRAPNEQAWRRQLAEEERRAQGGPAEVEPRPAPRAADPPRRVIAPEPAASDDGGDDILIV